MKEKRNHLGKEGKTRIKSTVAAQAQVVVDGWDRIRSPFRFLMNRFEFFSSRRLQGESAILSVTVSSFHGVLQEAT